MRREDWLRRLLDIVEENKPFVWGENDCCTFAARCVDAMTGSDWVEDLSNYYWDQKSAREYIADSGGIEAAVTNRIGEPVPPMLARRGDVCLLETGTGYGLGICAGRSALTPSDSGLVATPMSKVIKAWRID